MSAFLCSNDHLSALALLAAPTPSGCDNAFQVLLAENCRSLEARYPEDPFCGDDDPRGRWARTPGARLADLLHKHRGHDPRKLTDAMAATAVIKLCDCYDYQACETGNYDESAAAKLVAGIRSWAISRGGQTKGEVYNLMPWGL